MMRGMGRRPADFTGLKVLMLVSELEDYTIALAGGVARHAGLVLAVPKRTYGRLAAEIAPEVDLRLLDWPRHRSLANPRFLFGLHNLVRRERPDVIHLLSNNTLWLNASLPFWRRTPVVTTIHDVAVHPGDSDTATLPRWATGLAVRQSGDLIVHGERLRRLAAEQYAKPLERVHVVPHPAITRYAGLARRLGLRRQADGSHFTLLMFGRIFAYKGLSQLIRAEALLDGRVANLRIVIAGRGDDPWTLADQMGDSARYEVRNAFVEDREVAQLFLDADAVALPYVEASQSGVLNLAAAFGKPVVASDVGELGATVAAHGLGTVVPAGDPAALAEAIAELATRPALARAFGANGRAWAEGPNAPATVGAATVALYREILDRAGRLPWGMGRLGPQAAETGRGAEPC